MAHIIEFAIAGLAGRKSAYSQKLNRDINVFFGINGSGKTSLLKILHAVLANNASLLVNVPFREAKVKIFSIDYNRDFTFTIERKRKKDISEAQVALLPEEDSGRERT